MSMAMTTMMVVAVLVPMRVRLMHGSKIVRNVAVTLSRHFQVEISRQSREADNAIGAGVRAVARLCAVGVDEGARGLLRRLDRTRECSDVAT
jgi:hypothetical protein